MNTPHPNAGLAVIMPIRNYAADAMRRCIASLRRQAGPEDVDILLADYGSSPAEAKAAEQLAAECGARYVWFDEKGPWNRSRAINLGVRATTAPVVLTSDADLVFAMNFCDTVLGLGGSFADRDFFAYAPMMDLPQHITVDLDDYDADYNRLLAMAKERIHSRGNVIFSRALFERMRGWEESYCIWGCEDNDFFDRATRSGAAVLDLKGATSFLHHWHVSNKRGAEAGAQVARNQLMYWPLEKKIPVIRTGAFADEPALPGHKSFQTPTAAIFVTNADKKTATAATLTSISEQTFRDYKLVVIDTVSGKAALQEPDGTQRALWEIPADENQALAFCAAKMSEDILGLIPAGSVFPNPDALTWHALMPLLKGHQSPGFMWRTPHTYTVDRQIIASTGTLASAPAKTSPAKTAAPFGNYGDTTTHSMSEAVKTGMLFSRAPIQTEEDLTDALAGEKVIGELNDADLTALRAQKAENPGDPYFDYWLGLALFQRGDFKAAHHHLLSALQSGGSLNHWRVAWAFARAAAKVGDLARVDALCKQIVEVMPRFWFARELPKHARGHYAQTDQEQVIERFFRQHAPRQRVFVEVGGFDGVHYSNVRRLQEHSDWKGLSVEPVSKNYAKLSKSYVGRPVTCVRAAVGTNEGEAELHVSTYPHLPDWGSDVATFVPKRRDEWVTKFGAQWVTEKVPVKTLTRILDENQIAAFDLLSVDVEGHDLSVLQSLDFKRFRPQLVIVEYGADRAPILRHMTEQGYALYHDNGVDLFLNDANVVPTRTDLGTVTRAEAAAVLNPHLLTLTDLPDATPVSRLAATQLVDGRRFDILLKYLYAHYRRLGLKTDFAKRAYLAHIYVFNGCREGDRSGKNDAQAFVDAFDAVISSVSAKGFDAKTSVVPIDPHGVVIDGTHRVAACLAAEVPVTCLQIPYVSPVYDYRYFRDRKVFTSHGLETVYADAAALAHVRLKRNTHIVSMFPSATTAYDDQVRSILERYTRIVYAKSVHITREAAPLLMRQIYEHEPWLGDWSNGFKGAQNKGGRCFDGDAPLRAFLVETDTPESLRACKNEIRALYANGQDAIHINDTYAETKVLATIYFNDNSIAFLNSAKPQNYGPLNEQFALYRKVLQDGGYDTDDFCIEGSATMGFYGIRSSRDLDYLSLNDETPDFGTKMVGNHASELHHHVLGRDEIIFDPANHFYFFGMKIATLDVLKSMKTKRAEKPKDFDDIALVDRWRGDAQSAHQPTGLMAKRDRYKDIYALLGGKSGVIVDGGANFGSVTELFRKQYPDATIHAFEPIPHLAANLRQKFSDDGNIHIHAQALGEAPGRAAFKITDNLVSSSVFAPADRLHKYHGEKVAVRQTVEVEIAALGEVVKAPLIDLIKFDLQGGEFAALKGCGADLLRKTKVLALEAMFVEVYRGQPLFADIDTLLRGAGFRLYNLYDLYTHEDGQLLQGDMVYLNSLFFN